MAFPDRPGRSSEQLREQFPSLAEGPYLNHAAIAPWPRCVAEAVQDFAEENLRHGPSGYAAWIRRETALREALARLVGAQSSDTIALMKNTTEGISTVAWGLDWQPGDNVVLPRGEFSSNRLPWLAQAACDVEIREVDMRGAADAEAALIDAMDARTRLLSVSAVQWSDGFRLDLQRLGDACHQRQVLYFVDAIQQLGALPIDVEACRIDFLSADAHKWLLGPEGIAVFYSRDEVRQRLALQQQGWHMFDNPWAFDRSDWSPARSARRFEAGSPNSVGQAAMLASVGLLLDCGVDRVADRVLQNTDYLIRRLQTIRDISIVSSTAPARRSGIVSFHCGSIAARELRHALAQRGSICSLRGGAIRLSPHFYQDEEVLEIFLRSLEEIVGRR